MPRLSAEFERRARDTIALYPQPRSALIPILHLAQEQDGWLTEDAMAHVAELLEITPAEVFGTASFYDMLFTEPVGRHLVSICTNIACLLNGGFELLEHAEERLGIKAGSTTADGQFTLEEVECIALCGEAPCLAVNWRFFGRVTDDAFDTLVDDLQGGRLAETVPPHGTLCRVRRAVGLKATGPARRDERAAPGATEGAGTQAPGGAGKEEGAQGEEQPRAEGDVQTAAKDATVVESPPGGATADAADPPGGGD